jgi:nucleoside-diphosphate-sugar epimerase
MGDRRRVLVTGASGEIASQILPELGRRYEVVLLDVRPTDRQGRPVPDVKLTDLTDSDRSRYQAYFKGIDAVVHLGYKHPGRTE